VSEPALSSPAGRDQPAHESALELSAEIQRLVRNEVEAQLAKEQKLLKDSVGLAAKIIGAAITIFLAIFTIFGLTTWRDIKQETTQIVKKQAEELIQKADSETSASSRLRIGVADLGMCWEASDDKEVSHAQEVRCTALG